MVHTPGFGGAYVPTQEIQAGMEASHGLCCLFHILVFVYVEKT